MYISVFDMAHHCRANKIYREKSIPMTALWCLTSVIMAEFIMSETQQPIIVILLIIYSPYLLKDLVEL